MQRARKVSESFERKKSTTTKKKKKKKLAFKQPSEAADISSLFERALSGKSSEEVCLILSYFRIP